MVTSAQRKKKRKDKCTPKKLNSFIPFIATIRTVACAGVVSGNGNDVVYDVRLMQIYVFVVCIHLLTVTVCDGWVPFSLPFFILHARDIPTLTHTHRTHLCMNMPFMQYSITRSAMSFVPATLTHSSHAQHIFVHRKNGTAATPHTSAQRSHNKTTIY